MALKDWKKTTGKDEWKRRIDGTIFTAEILKSGDKKMWVYELDNGVALLDFKERKNKSQAVTLAKNYMRNN